MSVITQIIDKGMGVYARYLGNGINYTRKVAGVPVTTNLKTGTKVAKGAYGKGTKLIELGEGNRLRQETGIRTIITERDGISSKTSIYLPLADGSVKSMPVSGGQWTNFKDLIQHLKTDNEPSRGWNFSCKSFMGKNLSQADECYHPYNDSFNFKYIKDFIFGKGIDFHSSH